MSNDGIIDFSEIGKFQDALTGILREGAHRLLRAAAEAELDEFPRRHEGRRTALGRKAAVHSGHHPERSIQTGIGPYHPPTLDSEES